MSLMGMLSSLPSSVSTLTEQPVKACEERFKVATLVAPPHVISVSVALSMTHHCQRDLGLVDQVIVLSFELWVSFLSHYEHNICRDLVWAL